MSAHAAIQTLRPGWTDERIETLKTLFAAGDSHSQIAKALGGVSRNAVIGKANRLGLTRLGTPSRPRAIAAPKPARPKPVVVKRPVVAKAAPVLTVVGNGAADQRAAATPLRAMRVFTAADPKPLAELGRRQCRTPVNDGQDPAHGWLYCGEPTEGGPYCGRCRPIMVDRKRTADSNRQIRRMRV